MIVFTCIDCDIEVTDIIRPSHLPTPTLCLECRTIREAPAEDRPALRKAFRKPESPAQGTRLRPGGGKDS